MISLFFIVFTIKIKMISINITVSGRISKIKYSEMNYHPSMATGLWSGSAYAASAKAKYETSRASPYGKGSFDISTFLQGQGQPTTTAAPTGTPAASTAANTVNNPDGTTPGGASSSSTAQPTVQLSAAQLAQLMQQATKGRGKQR